MQQTFNVTDLEQSYDDKGHITFEQSLYTIDGDLLYTITGRFLPEWEEPFFIRTDCYEESAQYNLLIRKEVKQIKEYIENELKEIEYHYWENDY